jgi:DNA-binding protein HU-beta
LNNKEFISALSQKTGCSTKDATKWVSTVIAVMTQELQDGNSLLIPEFGTFDVKKKMERISVNPTTKQRMLIPPKLVLGFKPCASLKEKIK